MNRRTLLASSLGATLLFTAIANALLLEDSIGRWHGAWPKEIEPLRSQARTLHVASGTQVDIYEITFKDRAQFEKLWPVLLSVKTPAAPLRLYNVGAVVRGTGLNQLESNATPRVRIYAPSYRAYSTNSDGTRFQAFAPWPKALYGLHGELPEFVIAEKDGDAQRWTAISAEKESLGFHYRARVDIDLVIDGQDIDLNRIVLPKNTPIDDHRAAP
ncbi:MAG: hypothetical protein JWM57_2857 [Phycisphaerales bacterium]|nr:hypothetical protein [Phycisphaerales bacterium]